MSDGDSFDGMYARLTTAPPPLLPPKKPLDAAVTPVIAALQLHPTLEAALHILNLDLPSAHFLVRHMQSPPAFEGMYLHGILHRIEGDYDNARCWYHDVKGSDVFQAVWAQAGDGGGKGFKEIKEEAEKMRNSVDGNDDWQFGGSREHEMDAGQRWLNKVQRFKESIGCEPVLSAMEEESRRELETVIKFCVDKFGSGRWADASSAWVQNSDEIKKISRDQISGNAGYRKF